jgi:MFS family permease
VRSWRFAPRRCPPNLWQLEIALAQGERGHQYTFSIFPESQERTNPETSERNMNAEFINVHEELAKARVRRFHWRLGATMGALTLFDGYDTFNPAYVIHYVMQPWNLKPGQAGLLVSSGLIGFLIGAAVHGLVADRIGRRVTLLGGLSIASVFTLATPTLGRSFRSFCTIRLLTGLGLGVLLPLATTYINELTPRHVANTYTIWGVGLGWAVGGSLAGVVGVFLTPLYGWKSLYWIGCFSFLLIPILYITLPESVKYLALGGRTEEIKAILACLRPEHAARYRDARYLWNRRPSWGAQ